MSKTTFYFVQQELDFLSNQKIQSPSYKESTKFLTEMNGIYDIIRKDGVQKIYQMLNHKHKSAVDFFTTISPNIKSKIERTDTLQLINIIDEIDGIVSGFSNILKKIERLDNVTKNHKLMQSFIADIKHNLKKKDIDKKSAELDVLVIDIHSQVAFFDYLKQYDGLKNTYPMLRNEINHLIKTNRGNNYGNIHNRVINHFPQIQGLTNQINGLDKEIESHPIMQPFLANLKQGLNTENVAIWQSEFLVKLQQCQDDVRYHQGWRVGDYHCYGNGVILDTKTNLYWYQSSSTASSHQNAINTIAQFNQKNHHNITTWRLPKVDECKFYQNALNVGFLTHQYFWTDTKASMSDLLSELASICKLRWQKNWAVFLIFCLFFIVIDFLALLMSNKHLCFSIGNSNKEIINKKDAQYFITIVSGK